MGGISGEGTAYSANDHEITPMFSGIRVVFMFFFFLVSFELQLQITLCYLQTFIQRMFIGNM